jgi:hypothetical protein
VGRSWFDSFTASGNQEPLALGVSKGGWLLFQDG